METSGPQTDLSLNYAIVHPLLTGFLRDETRQAGFERCVVGLSGGIDSAVTATLAAEALGKENVLAVMMPYRTSSPESLADARMMMDHLGIRGETVDITSMVDGYAGKPGAIDKLRAGNIMARQRMVVLYDISARDKALVFGTSNKTESLLGYGTLFGDMASAINPLGDLYKSQVWDLAAHLGVPKRLIEKMPSADLWIGQTDESELGFSYRDVDRLLYLMIDERRNDEELAGAGFDREFIARVRALVRQSQFKRRLPVIAKVSHRTVNVDFRYPRDWGI
jgi:NAD+ synthase